MQEPHSFCSNKPVYYKTQLEYRTLGRWLSSGNIFHPWDLVLLEFDLIPRKKVISWRRGREGIWIRMTHDRLLFAL